MISKNVCHIVTCTFCFFIFLLLIYQLQWAERTSGNMRFIDDPNDPCIARVVAISRILRHNNITRSCSVLDPDQCSLRFQEESMKSQALLAGHRYRQCVDVDIPGGPDTSQSPEDRDMELSNPVAFNIMAHGDPRMLELLLAGLYRTHHYYCLIIDSKSSIEFKNMVEDMVNCIKNMFGADNIFTLKHNISIEWGTISGPEAEKLCMVELLSKYPDWKYFANFAGSEMPMFKTSQIIKYGMQALPFPYFDLYHPGAGLIEDRLLNRIYGLMDNEDTSLNETQLEENMEKLRAERTIPFNLTIVKGYKNYIAHREWIDFYINHPVSQTFFEWGRPSFAPDEQLPQTLSRIVIPALRREGEEWIVTQDLNGVPDDGENPIFPTRKDIWSYKENKENYLQTCHGTWRNSLCVFTLEDLPNIWSGKEYVINKFDSELDPSVVSCIAEFVNS